MNNDFRKDVEGSFHGLVWYNHICLDGRAEPRTPSSGYLVPVLTLLNTKHFVNLAVHDVKNALSCMCYCNIAYAFVGLCMPSGPHDHFVVRLRFSGTDNIKAFSSIY